jgi:hypothetical protein
MGVILPQAGDDPQGRQVTHRAVMKASGTSRAPTLAVAATDITGAGNAFVMRRTR